MWIPEFWVTWAANPHVDAIAWSTSLLNLQQHESLTLLSSFLVSFSDYYLSSQLLLALDGMLVTINIKSSQCQ
jgi:hypothetical protein